MKMKWHEVIWVLAKSNMTCVWGCDGQRNFNVRIVPSEKVFVLMFIFSLFHYFIVAKALSHQLKTHIASYVLISNGTHVSYMKWICSIHVKMLHLWYYTCTVIFKINTRISCIYTPSVQASLNVFNALKHDRFNGVILEYCLRQNEFQCSSTQCCNALKCCICLD